MTAVILPYHSRKDSQAHVNKHFFPSYFRSLMEENLFIHQLSNGLRVLHRKTEGEVVHCALLMDAGTRDEPEQAEGLAHFIEHTLFKGTRKRSAMQVLSRLDAVGGELNAWTSKEETCLYTASSLHHFERSVELLADILLHSTFPARELEKEKEVIAEEIRMYLDSPAELLLDEFEAKIFDRHPLGKNILGTEESLRRLNATTIRQFLKQHYHASRIIFCTTGNIEADEAFRLAEKYFRGLSAKGEKRSRQRFRKFRAGEIITPREIHQAHCVIGGMAADAYDRDRTATALVMNLLGGPAMNSRLNIAIRERNGLAYTVEAAYNSWTDNGMYHIYFGTDAKHVERCRKLISKELNKLAESPMPEAALRAAKKQMQGQFILSQEGKLGVVLSIARGLLLHNRIISADEVLKNIEAISTDDVLRVSARLFAGNNMTTMAFVPQKNQP